MFRCGKCERMHELAEGKCICGNDLVKNSLWGEDEPEPIPPDPDPVNRGGGGSGPGPTPDPDPVNPGGGGAGPGPTPSPKPNPKPVNSGGGWLEPELTPPAPRPKKGKIVKRVLLVLLILFLVVIAAAAGAYLADSAGTDGNRDGQSSGTGDSLGEEDPGNAGPSDERTDNDEEETGHMLAADGVDLTGPNLEKEDIIVISFEDSLMDAPEDAWDVSAEGDGSVLAWAELVKNFYTLHIGSEGGVIANPSAEAYFQDYPYLYSVYFNDNFDTSSVESMRYMFDGCALLENIDLSSLDTSNVKDMERMFQNCSNLKSLDLTAFDTSSVENMICMFGGCSSLTDLDLSSFDMSNVKNMEGMFELCSSLESLDLTALDTSSAENMRVMFNGCSSLSSLDLSSFDTSNVKNMEGMFQNCSSLISLDLRHFNTSGLEDMDFMFNGCSSLTELALDYDSFDPFLVTSSVNVFEGMPDGQGYWNTFQLLKAMKASQLNDQQYEEYKESVQGED